MLKIIVIISLLSNLALAQDAIYLSKGTPSPYSGDLLPTDKLKALYDDSLDKSSLQKQLDLANQNVGLLQQDKTLLLDQNAKLLAQSKDAKTTSDIEKGLWFLGGILLTGLAVKAAASIRP